MYRGNVIKRKESGSWMQWIGASGYLWSSQSIWEDV